MSATNLEHGHGECEADMSVEKEEKVIYETLAGRCLAVVFKERRHRKRNKSGKSRHSLDKGAASEGKESEAAKDSKDEGEPERLVGMAMFTKFQKANSWCFWNPHLEESMRYVSFAGWLEPSTLLVTGKDIYLETLKGAWAKKILRPPATGTRYHIVSVGEVFGLDMQVVPQIQFTPLPDALCVIISELNQENQAANLQNIASRLKRLYHGVHPPAEEIVFETLDNLIQQRKIFYTGQGYQIMTPALLSMPGIPARLYDAQLIQQMKESGISAFYLPVMAAEKKEMATSACQTSRSLENLDSSAADSSFEQGSKGHPSPSENQSDDAKLERNRSMRSPKSKLPQQESFNRTGSTREKAVGGSPEEASRPVKDINLKTSQAHQDKNKGEKASLFSKLFGRNKKRTESPGSNDTVEYMTFSAQFPPPEWKWYESQYDSPAKLHGPQGQTAYRMAPPNAHAGSREEGPTVTPGESSRRRSDYGHQGDPNVRRSHQRRRSGDRKERSGHRHSTHITSHHLDHSLSPHRLSYNGTGVIQYGDAPIYEKLDLLDESSVLRTPDHKTSRGQGSGPSPNRAHHSPRNAEGESSPNRNGLDSTFCDEEISIKYQGRLPKKDGIYAMSRESGVNCVGITSGCIGAQQASKHTHGVNHAHPESTRSGQAQQQSKHTVTHIVEVHAGPSSRSGVKDKQGKIPRHRSQQQHCQPTRNKHRPSSGPTREGAESRDTKSKPAVQIPTSADSISVTQISCSDKYPPFSQMPRVGSDPECNQSCSSSKSSASKATVIEAGKHKAAAKTSPQGAEATTSYTSHPTSSVESKALLTPSAELKHTPKSIKETNVDQGVTQEIFVEQEAPGDVHLTAGYDGEDDEFRKNRVRRKHGKSDGKRSRAGQWDILGESV